jgi:ureidoglycolate lyase
VRAPGIDDLRHDPAAHQPVLDMYHVAPSQLPFSLVCLERHPLTAQVFVPMRCARLLIVVAPDDASGQPDMSRARAFINENASIIHYRAGVWHAPLVALDDEARLTMLMWEAGTAQDCEELALSSPIAVTG